MGLFDMFTGKSAKDAANQNRAVFQGYQDAGLRDLDTGMERALPELDNAIGAYSSLDTLGAKYGRGTDLLLDSMGVNGAEGSARGRDAFTAGPGYQFMVDEATDRAQRAGARFSPGGNEIDQVTRVASGLAGQEWNAHLGRLGALVAPELQATSTAAGGRAAGFGAKAGAYGNDAQSRVNIRGNAAGGIANSNNQAAQAQMNASSQFWNGLMSLGGNVAKAFAPVPVK